MMSRKCVQPLLHILVYVVRREELNSGIFQQNEQLSGSEWFHVIRCKAEDDDDHHHYWWQGEASMKSGMSPSLQPSPPR